MQINKSLLKMFYIAYMYSPSLQLVFLLIPSCLASLVMTKKPEDGMAIDAALSGRTMRVRPDICWKYIHQIESVCRTTNYNATREAFVALESKLERLTVLTQNVDALHHNAGTKNLIEFHENIQNLFCISCAHEKYVRNVEGMKIPLDCDGTVVILPELAKCFR